MRKSLKISLLSIALLALVCFTLYNLLTPSPIPELILPMPGQAIPAATLTVNPDIKANQTQANLYRVEVRHKERYAEFERAAAVFGLDAINGYFERLDNNLTREMVYENGRGFWRYNIYGKTGFPSKEAPSNDEAQRIATRFLEENGLKPDRFTSVSCGRNMMGTLAGIETQVAYSVSVMFYPVIDGCDVYGVSRITVEVGEGGEIEAVRSYYKDHVFDRVVDLAPPEQFYDTLFSGNTMLDIDASAVSAKIESVKMAYWEDAGTIKDQPYLQPVWVFNGTSLDANGIENEFSAIVPAVQR